MGGGDYRIRREMDEGKWEGEARFGKKDEGRGSMREKWMKEDRGGKGREEREGDDVMGVEAK